MQTKTLIINLLLLAFFFLLASTLFVVYEYERAIVLRFGALVEENLEPGLHFKLPFVDKVRKFNGKVLTLDSVPEVFLTAEEKPLVIDSFVKWRVISVSKFYTATSGDIRRAERLLQQRVNEGLRNQVSSRDMHLVVSEQRDELMDELTVLLDESMQAEFGVKVLDVRVKRIELSEEVSESVFRRMRTAREIVARQTRSTGKEAGLGIRSNAEKERTILLAEAYREAQELRGSGDALAADIYAKAYGKNPEFYRFYRSMEAYRNTFSSESDFMLIEPDGDFFKYFKDAVVDK